MREIELITLIFDESLYLLKESRYIMKMNYDNNVKIALNMGFEEVYDEKAYKGKCYKKDGLLWIHDIEALKASLNFDENKLKHYDDGSYYYYVGYRDGVVDRKRALELIKAKIHSDNSVLSGRFDLLKNKSILDGMIDLFCEGYREEALSDYADQILKK